MKETELFSFIFYVTSTILIEYSIIPLLFDTHYLKISWIIQNNNWVNNPKSCFSDKCFPYINIYTFRKEKEEEKERLKKLKLEKKREDRKKEKVSCEFVFVFPFLICFNSYLNYNAQRDILCLLYL